jgi:hypothetical protein
VNHRIEPSSLVSRAASFRQNGRAASWAAALLVAIGVFSHAPAQAPAEPFKFEDYLIAPLRVHLLASPSQPALCTTLAKADIERIMGKVNRVWSQAGICFYVESVLTEEPRALERAEPPAEDDLRAMLGYIPEAGYRADLFNVYYLKRFSVNGVYLRRAIFVQDKAALRPVEGGIDEPIPRVTSHELGHALGLPHRQDTFNLMASGTTGTTLNAAEIESTRKKAGTISWFSRAPEMLAKADALQADGKADEARALYGQLSALPLEGEPLARIRAETGK